ncbi:LysR family transcriptional regulator [Oceanicola sp. 22II-s10i]|uniref:LysR family transcriptional regulator n=1 Tax=Oceanicola sp. 22II-s10i TaxID=1317116 RepID=UPI000B51EB43|nr:LysR family transcriptional regulator [Oceanicola sp. 22II-s10i]
MKEIQLHRLDLNLLVVFEVLMTEGSVAKAADKLGKTPSAVSHALARLREQVGDPLMVKVGGRLQASPFALQLIEEVVPILGSIKRVLQLPEPFDPGSSVRTFRIASPIAARVLADVVTRIGAAAPNISIDWLSAPRQVYAAVAEGHIDMAHLGGERSLPDGLDMAEMPPLRFVSFVRQGHPALSDWGLRAWRSHGHVKVAIDNEVRSPVDEVPAGDRHIAARISEFAGVGPLLASSDLIATLPSLIMAWDMERYGLVPLPPVVPLAPFRVRFFWSSRTANDPASVWLRDLVMSAYREADLAAEAMVAARLAPLSEGRT